MWPTARVMSHCTHFCHISLRKPGGRHPCSASLKDGDSGLVVAEQVNELVRALGSPQLDGQCDVESLEMAVEGVVP